MIHNNSSLKELVESWQENPGDLDLISKIESADVSKVTGMYMLFSETFDLKLDLSNWDTSSVRDMSWTFKDIDSLDLNKVGISNWDTSKVTDMSFMFAGTNLISTNLKELASLDVSSVTDMRSMFTHCNFIKNGVLASLDIGEWNVSSVTDMSSMFSESNFNSDISKWNINNVKTMYYMFRGCRDFNQDISNWNLNKDVNINLVLSYTRSFDQNLTPWLTKLEEESFPKILKHCKPISSSILEDFNGLGEKDKFELLKAYKVVDDYVKSRQNLKQTNPTL